jgi:DNA-binding SARP family transcriptional activator
VLIVPTEPWRIELLGGLRARRGDVVIDRFATRKTGALLARLAYYPDRIHSREELMELFWPEMDVDAARHNLRQTLFTLRRLMEPPGKSAEPVLLSDQSSIRLAPGYALTDVAEFESVLRVAKNSPTGERLEDLVQAAEIYHGELLAGHYDEWLLPERRRLEAAYLAAIQELQSLLLEAGDPLQAVQYALRAAAANPYEEETHCAVMRLYAAAGQTEAVQRHFVEFRNRLQDDLEEQPSETMCQLAEQLTEESKKRAAAVQVRLPDAPLSVSSAVRARHGRKLTFGLATSLVVVAVAIPLITPLVGRSSAQGASSGLAASTLSPVDAQLVELERVREGEFAKGMPSQHDAARQRHAAACLALSEQAWSSRYGPDEDVWVKRLDKYHNEFRAALRYYSEREPEKTVQLAGALSRFWYLRGHAREGHRWLTDALASTQGSRSEARARALVGCAYLSSAHDAKAVAQCMEALDIYRERGDRGGIAHATRHLGYFASERIDSATARRYYEQALAIFTELKDERGQAVTLLCLGHMPISDDPHFPCSDETEAWGRRSLALFRKLGSRWGIAMALDLLATTARTREHGREATALLQEAVAARNDDAALDVQELTQQALLADSRKDHHGYCDSIRKAIAVARDQGDQIAVAKLLSNFICYVPHHDKERRIRLLCAAGAFEQKLGIRANSNSRYRQEILNWLRREVGADKFRAASQAGLSMPWDQLVEETLTEL